MLRIIGHRESCRHSKCLLLTKLNSNVLFLFRNKSHYKSLEVESDASPQDIKSAYYKLSLKYHPDKNKGSAESVEKFREITEAYETLSNTNKKRIYDESLKHRYSESEWRRGHYSPRSYRYQERRQSKPPTGRSEHYNYDEHYKKHYEEYEKMRQADYEYFKRHWEANFRRRYPFDQKPDWSENRENQQGYRKFNWKNVFYDSYFVHVLLLWSAISLVSLPFLDKEPPSVKKENKPPTPIYYKVKRTDDNEE